MPLPKDAMHSRGKPFAKLRRADAGRKYSSGLAGMHAMILEVLIISFQEAKMQAIHIHIRQQVGAKENSVRIVDEELASAIGLTAQFGSARAKIDGNIGISVQHVAHIRKILGRFRHVSSHEGCLGMAGEDAIALSKQFAF